MSDKSDPDKQPDTSFRDLMGKDTTPLQQDKLKPWKEARKPVPLEWPEEMLMVEDDLSDTTPVGDEGPDTILEYQGHGLQDRVMRQLKRGQIPFYDLLDLHGHSVGSARETLFSFIENSQKLGAECVLVIHGKGIPSRPPLIKRKTRAWLQQMEQVKAFASAQQEDGGTGAVYVLIKRAKP